MALSLLVLHEGDYLHALNEKLKLSVMANLKEEGRKNPCIAMFTDITIAHALEADEIYQRILQRDDITMASRQNLLKMSKDTVALLTDVRRIEEEATSKSKQETASGSEQASKSGKTTCVKPLIQIFQLLTSNLQRAWHYDK